MEAKIFARGHPIFRASFQRLSRLADHLELVVTKQLLECALNPLELRRNRIRLRNVVRDDQAAPNTFRRLPPLLLTAISETNEDKRRCDP